MSDSLRGIYGLGQYEQMAKAVEIAVQERVDEAREEFDKANAERDIIDKESKAILVETQNALNAAQQDLQIERAFTARLIAEVARLREITETRGLM